MISLGEKIFRSIQGENDKTGRLSIWIRFGGCNLRCGGFFQTDPTDPSTWIKPLPLEPKEYKNLLDLPVIPYGCDSLYSIDPKFKHLWIKYETAKDLVVDINNLLYDGQYWYHPITKNPIDLCFTGGEPMLQQKAMVNIMKEIDVESKKITIQIETNSTKPVDKIFADYVKTLHNSTVHFNISPKLFNVSGEKDVVNYENILQYQNLTNSGSLKFVVNNLDTTWNELNGHVVNLRDIGVTLPIFVMPVGATKEQQEDSAVISGIANRAIASGYNVSGRLHCVMFGNGIGT